MDSPRADGDQHSCGAGNVDFLPLIAEGLLLFSEARPGSQDTPTNEAHLGHPKRSMNISS